MIDIGPLEILTVVVIVLIVVRPEDLPKLVRQLGKWYGRIREYYRLIIEKSREFKEDIENMTTPPVPDLKPRPAPTRRGVKNTTAPQKKILKKSFKKKPPKKAVKKKTPRSRSVHRIAK